MQLSMIPRHLPKSGLVCTWNESPTNHGNVLFHYLKPQAFGFDLLLATASHSDLE